MMSDWPPRNVERDELRLLIADTAIEWDTEYDPEWDYSMDEADRLARIIWNAGWRPS